MAAKTGTAEVVNKQTTSLFASYAPANNPKYAVVVAVTQAGVGAEVSTLIARKIYEAIFGIKDGKVEPAQSVLVGGAPKTDLPTIVGTRDSHRAAAGQRPAWAAHTHAAAAPTCAGSIPWLVVPALALSVIGAALIYSATKGKLLSAGTTRGRSWTSS